MTLIAYLYCLKKETFSRYTEDAIHLLLKRHQPYCHSSLIGFFFLSFFLWSFLSHMFPYFSYVNGIFSSFPAVPAFFSSLFNFFPIAVDFGEEEAITAQAQDKTLKQKSRIFLNSFKCYPMDHRLHEAFLLVLLFLNLRKLSKLIIVHINIIYYNVIIKLKIIIQIMQ